MKRFTPFGMDEFRMGDQQARRFPFATVPFALFRLSDGVIHLAQGRQPIEDNAFGPPRSLPRTGATIMAGRLPSWPWMKTKLRKPPLYKLIQTSRINAISVSGLTDTVPG